MSVITYRIVCEDLQKDIGMFKYDDVSNTATVEVLAGLKTYEVPIYFEDAVITGNNTVDSEKTYMWASERELLLETMQE